MNKEDVTKEDYESYEQVRSSGAINMFDVAAVARLGDISRETIMIIMQNYAYFMKKFPGVRKWVTKTTLYHRWKQSLILITDTIMKSSQKVYKQKLKSWKIWKDWRENNGTNKWIDGRVFRIAETI